MSPRTGVIDEYLVAALPATATSPAASAPAWIALQKLIDGELAARASSQLRRRARGTDSQSPADPLVLWASGVA